jgi:hypothetical protein
MKLKKDRLIGGAFSGVIAATIQAGYGYIVKGLKLTDRAFVDFSKTFFMYKNYHGLYGEIMGIIIHLALGAVWGVGFAYLIKLTSSRYYYIKGFGYGVVLWLFIGTAGTVLHIPLFIDVPPYAVLSTLIGGLVFGFVNAYILKVLEKKTNLI